MYSQPGADMFASMQQRAAAGGGFGFPQQLPHGFGAPPQQPQPQQPRGAPFGGLPQQRGPGGFGMPPQQPQARIGFGGAPMPQQPRADAFGAGFGGGFGAGLPQQMPQLQQHQPQQHHRGGGPGDGQQQQRSGFKGGGGKGGGSGGGFGQGRGGGSMGGADPIRNFQGMREDGQQNKGKGKRQPAAEPMPPRPQHPIPQLSGDGIANWSYGMSTKGSVNPGPAGAEKGGSPKGKGGKGMPSFSMKGGDMDSHSNVFVGNLPEGTSQQVLEAAFSNFGTVQSCYVATKGGRTYGFVKFGTVDAATRSIAAMNGQSGWVVKFANKDAIEGSKGTGKSGPSTRPAATNGKATHSNVFVGNLQEGITEAQLENVFKAYGKVDSCVVMNKTEGKTYGFVEFSTCEEAKAAVDGLNGQSGLVVKFANNDKTAAGWEESVPHSNLFVGQLPKTITEASLREACEKHGQVQSCTIKSDSEAETCYGFVKMATTAGAKRVITALDGSDGWSVKCANHDVAGAPGGKGMGFFGGGWGGGKGGKADFWPGGGWVWTNQNESDRPEPEPHDNLYVKNLPPGIKEEEICETFAQAGDVVECRILRWDGTSECAALVRMGSLEQAAKAKEMVNGKVHQKCLSKITVALQQKNGETVPDHCFVKGLHCTASQEQLEACFGKIGEVKWCKILPLPFRPSPSNLPEGCGLVQMATPEEASAAVEKLNETVPPECGAAICVRYAEVQGTTERPEQKPNANLYVKGWPVGFPDFLLQGVFQQYGQVVRLRLLENPDPEQPTCAALVLMAREEDATVALKALHRQTISPPVPAMRLKHAGREQALTGNLYVSSLPRTITEQQIRDTFKKYGEVVRLRLLNQEKSPELRALVELSSKEQAALAVRELDNTSPVFSGVMLHVQYATKREVAQADGKGGRKGDAGI